RIHERHALVLVLAQFLDGRVAEDLHVTDVGPVETHRIHHSVGPERGPVLADMPAEVPRAAVLARRRHFLEGNALLAVVRLEQSLGAGADDFLRGIAEDAFRTMVPKEDRTV